MADQFTQTTTQSWGSRIVGSIVGVGIGILLILGSIALLWWNEGRAVTTVKSLAEGAATVLSVKSDAVESGNNGKLIHISGEVTMEETLRDATFGISDKVLRLTRNVEMYQWKESEKSETKEKLGGGTETVTTYTYDKAWSGQLIDSSEFKQPADHKNPTRMIAQSNTILSDDATLGAFEIPDTIIAMMPGDEALPLTDENLSDLPSGLKSKAKLSGEAFYFGNDPDAPVIGDQKVSFKVLKPGKFSIVGAQQGETLETYTSSNGGEILLVEAGDVSAALMFAHAQSENAIMTWILRVVGFVLMWIGFGLFFGPISTFASVIPLLGNILGAGLGLASLFLAGILSLLTVSLAWLAYRPILGVILLILAIGGIILAKRIGVKRIAAAPAK